jgi:hypothetical protein
MSEKPFLAKNGDLYIGVQISLDDTELTEEKYHEIQTEREVAFAKNLRDQKITAVKWRIERHSDQLALGIPVTESVTPVLEYIQALRDVPQQPNFPYAICWPEAPN